MNEKVMTELEDCFEEAIREKHNYIGVLIQMEWYPEPILEINQCSNFEAELEDFKIKYNEDLTLKDNDYTKIIDFAYGDTVKDVAELLEF